MGVALCTQAPAFKAALDAAAEALSVHLLHPLLSLLWGNSAGPDQ